jgi:hypothetical protein
MSVIEITGDTGHARFREAGLSSTGYADLSNIRLIEIPSVVIFLSICVYLR